jgi:hypothetical protein
VAVVQISRIQVRRGQKNQGSGLPQLASGELGWAIDTRELYIGNGAVSEGAPAVGNTKVLTEYDDLFRLADAYTYRADESYILTGPNSSNPVSRTLQERLDDRVSVRSFGAKGDGVQIATTQLQTAIDQLYINSANKSSPQSRVVLHLEAGEYLIDDVIYLPPNATLVGAGSGKTIIKQTTAGKGVIQTVNSSSTPGAPANDSTSTTLNQAQNIYIEGITLEVQSAAKALVLQSCRDSRFVDVHVIGPWASGDAIVATNVGIELNSLSGIVESSNNDFVKCRVSGFAYGVISNWDIDNVHFHDSEFETLGYGVVFGETMILGLPSTGQSTGPSNNTVVQCKFTDVNRHGLWIEKGLRNTSRANRYVRVGCDGGTEVQPAYSVIKFVDSTNQSESDYFGRTQELISGAVANTVPYIPEVEGPATFNLSYENEITFGKLAGTRLFRLPADTNQSFDIDYSLVSQNYDAVRNGTLNVTIDARSNPNAVQISDDYNFVGDESYSDNYEFGYTLRDADSDLTIDTIDVNMTSLMPIDDQTEFKFVIKSKKTVY